MIIEFNGDSVNLDKIETQTDALEFIESVKPQDKIDLRGGRSLIVNDEYYALHDLLTPKEKAIVNLDIALTQKTSKLRQQLFPADEEIIDAIAKAVANKQIEKSPVDPDVWSSYVKCMLLSRTCKMHIEFSIFSRLGYDMHYVYNSDGQIYTLKDLRDYTKSPIKYD